MQRAINFHCQLLTAYLLLFLYGCGYTDVIELCKRVRPAICLITCEALGGNTNDAIHFALAIEIMHNMFLMHDDIEDGDTIRRDQPTVWVKYGTANAINAGDYLLACAYKSVLASPVSLEKKIHLLQILTLTYEKTVEGQALDINARAAEDFSVDKYMAMVELKTGYYLACGMVGGAVVSGISEKVVEKIWSLGKTMGPAFQIRDDLIDLTHGKGRGGAIGSDVKEGKASFLSRMPSSALTTNGEHSTIPQLKVSSDILINTCPGLQCNEIENPELIDVNTGFVYYVTV